MKYKDSKKILKIIKRAKKILINVHRNPDPDSIGSALAFYEYLINLKKDVKVICPDKLSEDNLFLPHSDKVEKVDFSNFNFNNYDLFLTLDSSSWSQVTANPELKLPNINILLIDHHITSQKFGNTNLIDVTASSTSEMVYFLFKDWKVRLASTINQNILAGIIGDTGVLRYPNVTPDTLSVVRDLMLNGANKNEITEKLYRNYSFNGIKFWGEIIQRMEIDNNNRFVYSAIPYEIFQKFNFPYGSKEIAASLFCSVVKDTDFGMIMIEEEKGILSVSFRSRKGFNVAEVAEALGGGGHIVAAGASIRNLNYKEAVEKVLLVARKYAQKSN